jgi:hypothetical protein
MIPRYLKGPAVAVIMALMASKSGAVPVKISVGSHKRGSNQAVEGQGNTTRAENSNSDQGQKLETSTGENSEITEKTREPENSADEKDSGTGGQGQDTAPSTNIDGDKKGGAYLSGEENSEVSLTYANSFIGGKGSYQGGLLLGEALQSADHPFLKNSGSASEQQWLESLILAEVAAFSTIYLEPRGEEGEVGDLSYILTLPSSWEHAYFMAKWGQGENTSDHAVWYLEGGDTLEFQLPNELSHAKIWLQGPPAFGGITAVPDASSALLLLGGSVVALEILRRKKRK